MVRTVPGRERNWARDYYVRIEANDYSVDPHVIGRIVDFTADLDRVGVRSDNRIVARPQHLALPVA